MTKLEEIRIQAEKATSGKWVADLRQYAPHKVIMFDERKRLWQIATVDKEHDAIFISHARKDILFLLEEIAKLKEAHRLCAENYQQKCRDVAELERRNDKD